jgi:hypothetical protein
MELREVGLAVVQPVRRQRRADEHPLAEIHWLHQLPLALNSGAYSICG